MRATTFILAVVGLAAAATAQPPAPGAAEPAAKPQEPPAESLPSLDEVLGLAKSSGNADKGDLKEKLSPEELRDEIEKTVELMKRAADRVGDDKDVGLDTQRVQEEILRRLDKLLEEAEKQRQQQQQQQQQRQKNQQQQNQQQQQQQKQQTGADQRDPQNNPANDSTPNGPAKRDPGAIDVNLAGSATWGNLPPHIREALMQGASDTYSAAYRQLTEQYYRRLAKERKP